LGYYAAFIDLGDREALVIGPGVDAAEKAEGLIKAGARVTVCATEPCSALRALAEAGSVRFLERAPEESDLRGCAVAVDASADQGVNQRMRAWATEHHVLLNVLDRPELCDFIAPALVRRGPLQVAVSTSGRSPFMASHLRGRIEADLGPEWGPMLELVGELRDRLRAAGLPVQDQQRIYDMIPGSGALELLQAGDVEGARRILEELAPEWT
jgi:siroheme synthase-like protein